MTNTTDTWKQNADRAMELFERKSPEQLAVELVQMQDKHTQAMAALDRMLDQRDQLAAQLKDATRQCGVMADLLRELREGAEIHLHNCTVCNNEEGIANWTGKLERIDAVLAGKFPPPVFFESTPSGVEIPDLRPGAIIRIGKTGDECMQVVPEGWRIVPEIPGESMCEAGASVQCQNKQSETDWIADVYSAMLAASPKP